MYSSYEINSSTLAIIPINEHISRIIETDDAFDVCKTTTEIVDDSCKFFGSSYLGRAEGTKQMIGVNYKTPIIVEESTSMIFFPTSSPRFNKCFWISLNNIDVYYKNKVNKCTIIFKGGKRIDLEISYGSLENQILRATRLEAVLRQRKMQ